MIKLPYGYIIHNGRPAINEGEALALRRFFALYISGMSIREAGLRAGVARHAGTYHKLLVNNKYLGNSDFPQIIDGETFDRAMEERQARIKRYGWHANTSINALPRSGRCFKVRPMTVMPKDLRERIQSMYDHIVPVEED